MLIEKIFDIISYYHHHKISSYAKNLGCKTLIDVGCHKGDFLNSFFKNKKNLPSFIVLNHKKKFLNI